jgi:hypothetical protein
MIDRDDNQLSCLVENGPARFPLFDNSHNVCYIEKPVDNTRCHRRGTTWRSMDAREVVGHKLQRDQPSLLVATALVFASAPRKSP